jgi:hypothetical protein
VPDARKRRSAAAAAIFAAVGESPSPSSPSAIASLVRTGSQSPDAVSAARAAMAAAAGSPGGASLSGMLSPRPDMSAELLSPGQSMLLSVRALVSGLQPG